MTSDFLKKYPNLTLLPQSNQVRALMTIIRHRETARPDFVFYSDRLIRLLVEKSLELLPVKKYPVITPLDVLYEGVKFVGKICAVSILRAGEAMEKSVSDVCKGIRIGKILIQRNEKTAEPVFSKAWFPSDISDRYVLLLDPMLATAGSAKLAIQKLIEKGVKQERIIFVNLVSCNDGIDNLFTAYPDIKVVTGEIDPELNDKAYIVPGLGDFGDRYFGTD